MAESRMFLLNGTDIQAVVARLESFLRTEKGMEVQSSKTTDGFVMQASQSKDAWKTITGMRLAISIQMVIVNDQLNVTIGEGQWSDKIGAGAIGLFIAWPLAITAGLGAYKQKKLPSEIFQLIESCILSGGQPIIVNSAGAAVTAGMTVCPNCKTQISAGSKFCNHCGTKLDNLCPNCGATIVQGSDFCAECGHKL